MQEVENALATPRIIVLDVYETILNMKDIERKVNSSFDSGRGYTIWFDLFMQYCFLDNCTGRFHDFISIARATMQMAGNKLGKTVKEEEIDAIIDLLKHLPVHEGVQEGLSKLNDMGYRIAALTNSPEQIVLDRMERTGLISYFESVMSAEQIRKYKPCVEVYDWAAKKLGTETNEMVLVSAHAWDIAGAANAGMQTAYLRRGRELLYPLASLPNFICRDLNEFAGKLADQYKPLV